MICSSGIYAVNTTATTVSASGTIPLYTLVRRYGCALSLNGTSIIVKASGYYDVDANITLTPTATGTITATVLIDGLPVSGANATVTGTASEPVTLNIGTMIRTCCSNETHTIAVTLSGDASVTNFAMIVEKL